MQSEFVGRFEIEAELPTEFLPQLIPILQKIEKLIPTWCHEVFVVYSHSLGTGVAAEINCRYDYRRATLSLSPRFFDEKNRQLIALVHELCHITQEPLWNVMVDIRTRLGELDKGNIEFVNELCRHAREQSVCDMTATMMQAFDLTFPSGTSAPGPSDLAQVGSLLHDELRQHASS